MPKATPITAIRQGAQYYLPFRVTMNGTATSPENVTDIKIKLGNKTWQYSEEALQYADGQWLIPLKQEWTMDLCPEIDLQISVKIGEEIYPSDVYPVKIDRSIIKDYF